MNIQKSMNNRRAEHPPNIGIMRIFIPNPLRMRSLDLEPNPISQIRVEFPIRMETITTLDKIFRVAALGYLALEDLHCGEIVVGDVEVLEFCAIVDDLLVHF